MTLSVDFNGTIPQHYEDYLIGFLFDGFAEDIVKRAAISDGQQVLELAAGTGIVTRKLLPLLPDSAVLTATDLQEEMLAVARKGVVSSRVEWAKVDMTSIPYEADRFDLVLCQFGLMLVPDRATALKEIYRVLKPGGRLVFNVWGDIHANKVWDIGGKVIEGFLKKNPILQDPGPFALNQDTTLKLMKEAGFDKINAASVDLVGVIDSAVMAAKGFVEGLPVVLAINKDNPLLLPKIEEALEQEFRQQMGDHPLQSPLQALVFEATK